MAGKSRDDFAQTTIDILAKRVGYRCSNPECRKPTSGPHADPAKVLNIGVASHITAASPGGPRYDVTLNSDQRKAPENGIWLCQDDGKLVDNDPLTYSADVLREWKKKSEELAKSEIGKSQVTNPVSEHNDVELIRFFSTCLDRPAFQDRFLMEASTEAFDKAIEDTITAINTGCLRSRDGQILNQAKGKSFLENYEWRRRMDLIVDLLRAIRSRYADQIASGKIHLQDKENGEQFHATSHSLAEWIDRTRKEILEVFSELCVEAGIPILDYPKRYDW